MKRSIGFKPLLHMFYDIIAVNFSLFLAFYFRYGKTVLDNLGENYIRISLGMTGIFLLSFIIFKFYSILWYTAGTDEVFYGMAANLSAGFVFFLLQLFLGQIFLPLVLLATLLSALFTLGGRSIYRTLRQMLLRREKRKNISEKVLVIGGGSGGTITVKEMISNPHNPLYPVAILDDDPKLLGKRNAGVPILGKINDLEAVAREIGANTILLAIPSLSDERKREILSRCKNTGLHIKTMPTVYEAESEDAFVKSIRSIATEELLGKQKVTIDDQKIRKCCSGKTVLVTGAGGMMGKEISQVLAEHDPKTLVVVDSNENSLIELHKSLEARYPGVTIAPMIATVKHESNIQRIFNHYRPEVVLHCAFLNKTVTMNNGPSEILFNNVFGTLNVAKAAHEYQTEKFIMLSTDKALRPNHLVNATQRIAEMIIQSMDQTSNTKFSAVRFGNVADNAHYYIERFKREIRQGGPLTLEDQALTRYFLAPEDAAKLIVEAGSIMKGGEVFALDMGPPLSMYNLAKDFITLSGYKPGKDIQISITGNIKPLDIKEEVLTDEHGLNKTAHRKILQTRAVFDNYLELKEKLDQLELILGKANDETITRTVIKTVKELIPSARHLTFQEAMLAREETYPQAVFGKSRPIWLASPHMGGLEQHYVKEAFDTNWIAPVGPNVNAFEKEMEEYIGVKSAAAMVSGTGAIHIALRLLDMHEGDYVFCSTLTFSGSANPIIYEKATPVFIDSEPDTWNMSPKALEKALRKHAEMDKLPKAVIVVNLYGQSADYDAIQGLCGKYRVPIIEDAAESVGATYKGKQTGTFGEFGVFSFNGNKIITTSGGGMLVSDDEGAIKKSKFLITQARDPARHYQHSELGFNYRMSNVVAGIGRGQLKVLEIRVDKKKDIYHYYKDAFEDIKDITMMPIAETGEPNYWLSALTIAKDSPVKPLDIILALEKEEIESRPVWKPMHMQPFYVKYPYYRHEDNFSVSEDLFRRGLCMPSDTKMTEEDLDKVIDIVRGLWMLEPKKTKRRKVAVLRKGPVMEDKQSVKEV